MKRWSERARFMRAQIKELRLAVIQQSPPIHIGVGRIVKYAAVQPYDSLLVLPERISQADSRREIILVCIELLRAGHQRSWIGLGRPVYVVPHSVVQR